MSRPERRGGLTWPKNSTFSEYLQRGENKAKKDKFMAKEKEINEQLLPTLSGNEVTYGTEI